MTLFDRKMLPFCNQKIAPIPKDRGLYEGEVHARTRQANTMCRLFFVRLGFCQRLLAELAVSFDSDSLLELDTGGR